MGKIKQGILGGFSGKVGTVVGGAWKGIDYMRSLATSISNPKSPAQVIVRTNFATIAKIMSKANPIIKTSDWKKAKKQTAYNAAIRINYHGAIVDGVIDFERLTFGEFSTTELAELQSSFGNNDDEFFFKANWSYNEETEASYADDPVAVVVVRKPVDGSAEEVFIDYMNVVREERQFRMTIGSMNSFKPGDVFYAYIGTGHKPDPRKLIQIPEKNVVKYRAQKTI